MISRVFLTAVGILYLGLGIWCAVYPSQTSSKVGFSLRGSSGMSEFVTVYGGLEVGLGLTFLLPLMWPESNRVCLLICILIHGSLVVFRTLSFCLFRNLDPFTLKLAAGEWMIFVVGLAVWFVEKNPSP